MILTRRCRLKQSRGGGLLPATCAIRSRSTARCRKLDTHSYSTHAQRGRRRGQRVEKKCRYAAPSGLQDTFHLGPDRKRQLPEACGSPRPCRACAASAFAQASVIDRGPAHMAVQARTARQSHLAAHALDPRWARVSRHAREANCRRLRPDHPASCSRLARETKDPPRIETSSRATGVEGRSSMHRLPCLTLHRQRAARSFTRARALTAQRTGPGRAVTQRHV